MGNDGRPVLATDSPNHQKPRLVDCLGRDFDQVRIRPKLLRFGEVNAVLLRIGLTLPLVELDKV
jgi:hypothetical protein